jgi:hypothetical protein
VAQTDLCRLYPPPPLRVVVRGMLQRGLTDIEIPRTFFSREVHPLHRREVTKRMHQGSSSPDYPFSMELGDMEINTRV